MEKLSLEGNFNASFNVYVDKGKEIEALQALEPNIMLSLLENYAAFGFECIDSHLYIFTNRFMGTIAYEGINRDSILTTHTQFQKFFDLMLPELQSFSH